MSMKRSRQERGDTDELENETMDLIEPPSNTDKKKHRKTKRRKKKRWDDLAFRPDGNDEDSEDEQIDDIPRSSVTRKTRKASAMASKKIVSQKATEALPSMYGLETMNFESPPKLNGQELENQDNGDKQQDGEEGEEEDEDDEDFEPPVEDQGGIFSSIAGYFGSWFGGNQRKTDDDEEDEFVDAKEELEELQQEQQEYEDEETEIRFDDENENDGQAEEAKSSADVEESSNMDSTELLTTPFETGKRYNSPQKEKLKERVAKKLDPVETSSTMSPWTHEINMKDVRVGECVGAGSFGTVRKGRWRGTAVAIKTLNQMQFQKVPQKVIEQFKREVDLLSKLRHPNIVLFMGASTKPEEFCLITEYMPRGSLWNVLYDEQSSSSSKSSSSSSMESQSSDKPKSQSNRLPFKKAMAVAIDVAKGLCFLHSSNPPIIHRDLKPANLLVDDHGTVKIADFGISRESTNSATMTGFVGTCAYMAPELIEGNFRYSPAVDIYSFAIILNELLSGTAPFPKMNPLQLAFKVKSGLRPKLVNKKRCPSHPVRTLIQKCWSDDPSDRLSIDEVLDVLLDNL